MMALSKVPIDPVLIGLGTVILTPVIGYVGYRLFRPKTVPQVKPASVISIRLVGHQKQTGMTLESHQQSQDCLKHTLQVEDADLEEQFTELGIPKCTELQKICGVESSILEHDDLLEYILKQDTSEIDLQLRFTKTDEFNDHKDHTKLVTFTFTQRSNKLVVDLESKDTAIPKPIEIVKREGKVFTEENCFVRWEKGALYITVKEDGTLGAGPLTTENIKKGLFVKRQYSGRTEDIPPKGRVFPNGTSVIVHLFHIELSSTVSYMTNTRGKPILTNRGQPLKDKSLPEQDPRLYYFERLPGTNQCVFISSCFPNQFLAYDEEDNRLYLEKIDNPSILAKEDRHDEVKFRLIPPRELESHIYHETSV